MSEYGTELLKRQLNGTLRVCDARFFGWLVGKQSGVM